MLKHHTAITLSFLFATLFGTAIAAAGTGGVRDSGDFFSEAAIKEATRKISAIETQFKKDLVVETFPDIPEEIQRGVDLSDKRALNKMFEQWTVKEAKQSRVNGIYILISKEPAHLQIVVGNDTQNRCGVADRRSASFVHGPWCNRRPRNDAKRWWWRYVRLTSRWNVWCGSRYVAL